MDLAPNLGFPGEVDWERAWRSSSMRHHSRKSSLFFGFSGVVLATGKGLWPAGASRLRILRSCGSLFLGTVPARAASPLLCCLFLLAKACSMALAAQIAQDPGASNAQPRAMSAFAARARCPQSLAWRENMPVWAASAVPLRFGRKGRL